MARATVQGMPAATTSAEVHSGPKWYCEFLVVYFVGWSTILLCLGRVLDGYVVKWMRMCELVCWGIVVRSPVYSASGVVLLLQIELVAVVAFGGMGG